MINIPISTIQTISRLQENLGSRDTLIINIYVKPSPADEGLLKRTWELQDFLLPDASASITESGHNVYCGLFCDKEVFFIEHALVGLVNLKNHISYFTVIRERSYITSTTTGIGRGLPMMTLLFL